jgi:hypothetical protein
MLLSLLLPPPLLLLDNAGAGGSVQDRQENHTGAVAGSRVITGA